MQVEIVQGERCVTTKSRSVAIPMGDSIYDVLDAAKKLDRHHLDLIIQNEGLEVSDKIELKLAFFTAISYVQQAWYEATVVNHELLSEVSKGHRYRVEAYKKAIEKIHEDKEHRKVKSAAHARARFGMIVKDPLIRIVDRRYRFASDEGSGDLRGFRLNVYEALAANPERTFTFEDLWNEVIDRGASFNGKDGGRAQVQNQVKKLCDMGFVCVSKSEGI